MQKNYLLHLFWIAILSFNTSIIHSQTSDNIVWAALKVGAKIDSKTSIQFAPIVRINNNISSYQNSSVDFSLSRKFGSIFTSKLTTRTWFMPGGTYRQFIWVDLGVAKTYEKLKLSSHIRNHWAIDLGDNKDADWIRWKSTASYSIPGSIKVQLSLEPWLRLNSQNGIRRMRYEPGIVYNFNKNLSYTLIFRREVSIKTDPFKNFNVIYTYLSYKF